jgi:CRISPR-associated protein Cmr3
MTIWLIEPRDPLIVRDGRPFEPTPGAQAISLPFPHPSTTTGGARSRAGLDNNGHFAYQPGSKELEELKKLAIRGPLLVQLTENGSNAIQVQWFAPAPLDAVILSSRQKGEDSDTLTLKRLVPLQKLTGAQTDFDHKSGELAPVGLVQAEKSKPASEAPHFWKWEIFQSWLLDPSQKEGKISDLSELGYSGLQQERRLHVSIDAEKLVAREGALFATSGLEFTHTGKSREKRLSEAQRLALAIDVEQHDRFKIKAGLAGLGGERRIVRWHESNEKFPSLPPEIEDTIVTDKACRVVLLTPAFFSAGYYPNWLLEEHYGVKPTPAAIALQRPTVVSGWDLENRRPKQSRRLAPAGSVFFLRLEGSEEAIRDWIKHMWMQPISDDEPSRLDGFGLAVTGTWSGKPVAMQ